MKLCPRLALVQLLSTKMVHFYDKSMKLCQITTNPKTNTFGYGILEGFSLTALLSCRLF